MHLLGLRLRGRLAEPSIYLDDLPHAIALATSERCPWRLQLLPIAGHIACALTLIACFTLYNVARDASSKAFNVMLLVHTVLLLNNTFVIPEAYQISRALGHDASFSGLFIGVFMAGFLAGASAVAALLLWQPLAWQRLPRALAAGSVLCGAAGGLCFLLAGGPNAGPLLLLGRAAAGFGAGANSQLLQVTMPNTVSKAGVPARNLNFFCASMLASGTGPVLASVGQLALQCQARSTWHLGLEQLVLCLAALAVVVLCCPSEQQRHSEAATADVGGHGSEPRDIRRRLAVCLGVLAMVILRGFVLSSLASASSLLLETKYGMDRREIGLWLGATFLVAIPSRFLRDRLSDAASLHALFRGLCALAAGASLLMLLDSGYTLLLADAVVFPCLNLGNAIAFGIMLQNLLPQRYLLDENWAALWGALFGCLSQFAGPWLSRTLLGGGGQRSYALQQLLGASCFWLLGEALVLKNHLGPDDRLAGEKHVMPSKQESD